MAEHEVGSPIYSEERGRWWLECSCGWESCDCKSDGDARFEGQHHVNSAERGESGLAERLKAKADERARYGEQWEKVQLVPLLDEAAKALREVAGIRSDFKRQLRLGTEEVRDERDRAKAALADARQAAQEIEETLEPVTDALYIDRMRLALAIREALALARRITERSGEPPGGEG